MRRLVVLLEAGDAYPSGKVRAMQYDENFRDAGYSPIYLNRLTPWLVRLDESPSLILKLFRKLGGKYFFRVMRRITTAINARRIIKNVKDADLIFASKISDYDLIKKIKKRSSCPLVMDIVDPLWLDEYLVPNFDKIIKIADCITTDNDWSAEKIRAITQNVFVIPETPNLDIFDKERIIKNESKIVTIGWVGSPGTFKYLSSISESLLRVIRKNDDVRLLILGSGFENKLFDENFEKVEYLPFYSELEMVRAILKMDIGLYPLMRIEGAEHRGILKALNYMAGSAAVVASPIGESYTAIRDGENGFLADSNKDWEERLQLLIDDSELRKKIAAVALLEVRKKHSRNLCFKKLNSVFEKAFNHTLLEDECVIKNT